jgi:hypothetical protein
MVQAWDGVSKNKLAHGQLTGAQSNFLPTGAYVLLTYFNNLSAQDQVAAAVQAVGSAITKLKLMAVEVKTCCGEFVSWKASTSYVAGARIMDTDNHIQKVAQARPGRRLPCGTIPAAQRMMGPLPGRTPEMQLSTRRSA